MKSDLISLVAGFAFGLFLIGAFGWEWHNEILKEKECEIEQLIKAKKIEKEMLLNRASELEAYISEMEHR